MTVLFCYSDENSLFILFYYCVCVYASVDVEVQYLPLIAPTQFVRCSIAGPYALLQCEDGTIHTVTFSMSESRAQISLESFSIVDVSILSNICLMQVFNTAT